MLIFSIVTFLLYKYYRKYCIVDYEITYAN